MLKVRFQNFTRLISGLATLGVLVFAFAAHAAEEFNVNADGFVLHGYDPVAYQRDKQAVDGNNAHTIEHEGARYRFVSAENLAAFKASPAKYVPAYGGWCAYGVRVGKKFDIDPKAFKVVNNRTYVQLDQGTQKVWLKDVGRNIAIADRLWPSLKMMSRKVLGE